MENEQEKLVDKGYIKLIAINVGHLESTIEDEKNTNFQEDIDRFREKYSNCPWIKCFTFHVLDDHNIMFTDYQKVRKNIHMFDYLRDLVKSKRANVIESDVKITQDFIE